jgi:hypothetical protein
MPSKKILLGEGYLNWLRGERISDRYGAIHLTTAHESDDYAKIKKVKGQGRLEAKIVKTSQSTHLGDWGRGFAPGGAKKGDTLILGEGTFFTEKSDFGTEFGVTPEDGRPSDWMDPKMLYKGHDQSVKIYWVPIKKGKQNDPKRPMHK